MKGILTCLLVISVGVNVFLLTTQKKTEVVQIIPEAEMSQVKEIAILCGVSANVVNSTSAKELLSDTKMFLLNTELYNGPVLSPEDRKIIEGYLYNNSKVLNAVKKQNRFLSTLAGKRILIMPSPGDNK